MSEAGRKIIEGMEDALADRVIIHPVKLREGVWMMAPGVGYFCVAGEPVGEGWFTCDQPGHRHDSYEQADACMALRSSDEPAASADSKKPTPEG